MVYHHRVAPGGVVLVYGVDVDEPTRSVEMYDVRVHHTDQTDGDRLAVDLEGRIAQAGAVEVPAVVGGRYGGQCVWSGAS